MPVDTSQEVTIFPQAIRLRMILFSVALGALGAVVLPFGWSDGEWIVVGSGLFLLVLSGLLTWGLARKRARGNPDPTLKVSPEGLYLMTGTTGLIPWDEINGLGSFSMRGNKALVINVNKSAFAKLDQGALFKKARKFDAALGVHALLFFQQQVEVPLHDLADMIHDYSIAHGGPPLQPNRTP